MGGRPAVEVRLLGDLEVIVGRKRAALPASKKTRALLGYLVVSGVPQLRSHLCDLLWQGPDDPRGALRWSLTKLRGVVGDGCIRADRERAEFVRDGVSCDAVDVRRAIGARASAASTEVLEEVAARFRGELFEGLDLPDCFRWHEWCVAQREAMRALRVEVLTALVERHAADAEGALAYARQRLAIDPIAESSHVAVVRLLTVLGRNREAGEQVEACRRILANELGAKPSPALLAARVRAEASDPGPSAATSSPAPSVAPAPATRQGGEGATAPVPFVGRDAELRTLQSAWQSVLEQRGDRTVVVVGDPGIGKTRLVDELGAAALAGGAFVLRGRAFEAEMVRPYGPWIDALRALATRPEARPFAEQLSPMLPGMAGETPTPLADRARVFDGVAGLLGAVASGAGCLVALDDLQWFDEASLALLHFVGRAPVPRRLLLACTARAGELAENAHAIRLVRSMQRDGRLQEIALGPLDADATSAIARAVDADVDAARVATDSAGNPFFALELARAAHRGAPATESLDALLSDRLDRLEPRARELLPWAAALGRGFLAQVLGKAAGLADGDLLSAVEELERRGVLRSQSVAEGGYDFAHDLVRVAAYRRLSAARRRFVHERIARVLAEGASADPSLHGDVVHHASLAGDHELAARASVSAAERCLRLFASDEAARLAETGLAHADRLAPSARIATRVALLIVKVQSGRWLRRWPELHADVSRVVAEARDAGMSSEAALALHWLSALQRDRGDLAGAHESTLVMLEVAGAGDALTRGHALARSAKCFAYIERDVERAHAMVAEAATLLPQHELDRDWCSADAFVRSYRGAPDGGLLVERALALARRDQDRIGESECLIRLVQLAIDRGDPARALAWCRELGPVAAKMTEGSEGAVADALEALARMASVVPGADRHLESAIARLRDIDAKGMLAYVLAAAADIDRAAGRVAQAQARAEEALAAAEAVQRRTLVASARASLAELALARGDRAGAALQLEVVAREAEKPFAVSERVRARLHRIAASLDG